MPDIPAFVLQRLFPSKCLFTDTNDDGYPDRVNLSLQVQPGLNDPAVWSGILNFTARLAAHVTALRLPLVVIQRQATEGRCRLLIQRPNPKEKSPAVLRRDGNVTITLSGRDGRAMGLLLTGLALSPLAGAIAANWHTAALDETGKLLSLRSREGTVVATAWFKLEDVDTLSWETPDTDPPQDLLDTNRLFFRAVPEEPRARALKLAIQLTDRPLSTAAGQALAHLVAWAALESTDIHLPMAFVGAVPGGRTVLRIEEMVGDFSTEPCLRWVKGKILARGDSRSLSAALAGWSRLLLGSVSRLPQAVNASFEAIHRARNFLGGVCTEGPLAWYLVEAAAKGLPLPAFSGAERRMALRAGRILNLTVPPSPRRQTVRRRFSWKGEDERLGEQLRRVQTGKGTCRGTILVSRPLKIRQMLKKRWENLLREKGYDPDIQVLNAYKPGLSWLMEVVRPRLVENGGTNRMELAFRTFEAGPGGLEMKSRWLQEAFPGPDLLSREMGLDPDAVRLLEQLDLPEAYRFRAWRKGKIIFEAAFTPRVSRLPYLPSVIRNQWVHPAAAGVYLENAQEVLLDLTLPTDREVFWRRFQEHWLPHLARVMDEHRSRLVSAGAPAFWEEVRLEVGIPESDERLQLGQERVCPLEALHEDLYFGLLAFYKAYAKRNGLGDELQFGRILPIVICRQGGRPGARLVARPYRPPEIIRRPRRVRTAVRGIDGQGDRLRLFFEAGGVGPEQGRQLVAVAGGWGMKMGLSEQGFHLDIRNPRKMDRPSSPVDEVPEPPANQRLDVSRTEEWVQRLGSLPHLRTWRGGISLQGRPIQVLEASLETRGTSSLGKARLLKPVLLLNARHHANEVSSTNAALRLAWRLSRTVEGQNLLRKVNVAFIPMENPDGVATLETLSAGCKDHKLHAARYNALGVEWYDDYHRKRPRFPEALVKRRLWLRWMPRFVLDAHGVPSHEWDQPFAGTVNPQFREYWIPRAFVFAILPFVDKPEHPAHDSAIAIASGLAEDMAAHADISAQNAVFAERYERYARAFEPEVFPASVNDALVVVPTSPRIDASNFGRVHWPVTETELITEVADEVVEGPWLEMCVRAHLTAAMTLLRRLAQTPRASLRTIESGGSGLRLAWRRPEGV
ncbi:MAG: M14 family metallopeptidase [Desulfobacterales bacterium]